MLPFYVEMCYFEDVESVRERGTFKTEEVDYYAEYVFAGIFVYRYAQVGRSANLGCKRTVL